MLYRTAIIIGLAALLHTPVQAQHHGMGGGHSHGQDSGDGHMNDMHSDGSMEHMSELMHGMNGNEHNSGEMMHDQHDDHMDIVSQLVGEMDGVMPHLDAMRSHMRSHRQRAGDEAMSPQMESLMSHMDKMFKSGSLMMATLQGLSGMTPEDNANWTELQSDDNEDANRIMTAPLHEPHREPPSDASTSFEHHSH